MKFNLGSHIIGSQQYLEYLSLKLKKNTWPDYIKNHDANDVLLPYKYTFENVSPSEISAFMIFYKIYLDKSEIEYSDLDFDSISRDPILLVTFIMAAQYYFL